MISSPIRKLPSFVLAMSLIIGTSGCGLLDQTEGQHGGTTVMLVGLSRSELAAQGASTVSCAHATIEWAAAQGSRLMMAPVGPPGSVRWSSVDFTLTSSAQRSNPVAAKHFRAKQIAIAERELHELSATPVESLDLLSAATNASRVLNYRRGPRTLVLCDAATQSSTELSLSDASSDPHSIQVVLLRLRPLLEPMRLTRVVLGAAEDTSAAPQPLAAQASLEAFWRAWAHHEGAIHFAWGAIPHFPY
jgi:hypothetical protein